MLIAPLVWYDFVPGVIDTGLFNQHFIRDIGIIQLFLGVAFGVGMIRPDRRIGLWAAATLWLIAHAVFHLWEVAVGICSPSVIPRDSCCPPAGDHRGGPYPLSNQSFARRESRIRLRSGKIAILTYASAELMAQTNHQTGALSKSLGRAGIRGAILCSPPA